MMRVALFVASLIVVAGLLMPGPAGARDGSAHFFRPHDGYSYRGYRQDWRGDHWRQRSWQRDGGWRDRSSWRWRDGTRWDGRWNDRRRPSWRDGTPRLYFDDPWR